MLKYFRNRKSVGWFMGAFLLMLVIVAFVALYIPDFMQPSSAAGTTGDVAWVDGDPISSQAFIQGFRVQESVYRQQMGAQYNPDLLRQLGLDNYIVQQLVQEKALTLEARRLGMSVSDGEVSNSIQNDPSLQQNGQFIGRDAYLNELSGAGVTPADYEQQVREGLLRAKLEDLVKDGVVVSDADVEEEYRRRNEKIHMEYTVVSKSDFGADYEPRDDEVRAFYDASPNEFSRPVQRKARFIALTPQLFMSAVTVTDREITRYYNENLTRFSSPEQVQASHILFKTSPEVDEAEIRAKAESVLAQAKGGADFAELATEHSEDTTSANGGDLGFFGRGQMVPEFDQAAFTLPVGAISDLVETQYGFHIIKVTNKQEALTQPLEGLREQIRGTLTQEKASARVDDAVESAAEKLQASGSIDVLTAEYELLVPQDTAFFGRADRIPQLSASQAAANLAFETEIGDITPAIPLGFSRGYAFLQILEERAAGTADFDEVRVEAAEKLRSSHAMDLAIARAHEIREALLSGATADVELQTSENFFRGTELPGAGRSVAAQRQAFELAPGEVSAPLEAQNGYVIMRIIEKSGFVPAEFEEQKAGFEEQILSELRARVWSAFVAKLQSRYSVEIDWQAIRVITG
ncbi:MAG: peptidyl-prolyl cis-trans isomerase [Acidobacteria bacterium]|nr:MAG: peptidyl-prolyl cis-trans isomerase [Acidobacteriota bacterium]